MSPHQRRITPIKLWRESVYAVNVLCVVNCSSTSTALKRSFHPMQCTQRTQYSGCNATGVGPYSWRPLAFWSLRRLRLLRSLHFSCVHCVCCVLSCVRCVYVALGRGWKSCFSLWCVLLLCMQHHSAISRDDRTDYSMLAGTTQRDALLRILLRKRLDATASQNAKI